MTDDGDRWRELIANAATMRPEPVQALTPVRQLRGANRPVVVDCNDGRRYVVKGLQVMRSLNADQIVGRLATAIDAPVPSGQLVHVSSLLMTPGSMLEHFVEGIGHGSLFIEGCVDSPYVRYAEDEGNEERFATLAVRFGWTD